MESRKQSAAAPAAAVVAGTAVLAAEAGAVALVMAPGLGRPNRRSGAIVSRIPQAAPAADIGEHAR